VIRGILLEKSQSQANHIIQELEPMTKNDKSDNSVILGIEPLDFMWVTADPFLFCVHHEDFYPNGNDQMGPDTALSGRTIGQDFTLKDGWRMYHGDKVPGFPAHPHRGFETVTVVKTGMVDHADSLGAAGRYGGGDVQWLTTGRGVQHSEMFPLLNRDNDNPLELFQIWLNLPKARKFVEPHFTMLWSESMPRFRAKDEAGKFIEIDVIAGKLGDLEAMPPPPDSWAADPDNHVAIWTIKLEAGATWTLPATGAGINRTLYYFKGDGLTVTDTSLSTKTGIQLRGRADALIKNGEQESELLLLQGRPINEPVAQYGPFVMNSDDEIQQAFKDYRKTLFGGWSWSGSDPVHPREKGRFARHADGSEETPAAEL